MREKCLREYCLYLGANNTIIVDCLLVKMYLEDNQVPQVVVYKIDKVTAWIARTIFKFAVKHISLVNLVLEEKVKTLLKILLSLFA